MLGDEVFFFSLPFGFWVYFLDGGLSCSILTMRTRLMAGWYPDI